MENEVLGILIMALLPKPKLVTNEFYRIMANLSKLKLIALSLVEGTLFQVPGKSNSSYNKVLLVQTKTDVILI